MFGFVGLCFGMLVRLFCERRSLLLKNLALRQQLVVLKRRHPRPCLGVFDKFFWVIARRLCSGWKQSLLIVTPEGKTNFCASVAEPLWPLWHARTILYHLAFDVSGGVLLTDAPCTLHEGMIA
jgi:hypothetical protein